jgi:hypothetical protein
MEARAAAAAEAAVAAAAANNVPAQRTVRRERGRLARVSGNPNRRVLPDGTVAEWSAAMGWVFTVAADPPRAEAFERRREGAPGWVRLPVVREYLRARGYGW